MPEKRERAKKYYISTRDNQYSLVVVAKDEADAAARWATRYGRSASEAVVRPIGAHARRDSVPAAVEKKKPPARKKSSKPTAAVTEPPAVAGAEDEQTAPAAGEPSPIE